MISEQQDGSLRDDVFDDYDVLVDCWQCGGEGGWASCMEDCCPYVGGEEMCDDPRCWRKCDICEGKGNYPLCPPEAPIDG